MSSSLSHEGRIQRRKNVAIFSIVLSIVLLAAKLIAWRMTSSTAIFADAMETIINVAAASMAYVSIVKGAKPPDEDHPYGHGKAEDFSAGAEGALIAVAAAFILWHSIPRLVHPPLLQQLGTGLLIILVTGVMNGFAGVYLIRQGREQASQALLADGYHLITDSMTSSGVLVGLILVKMTGWLWMDPLAAIAVAVHILVVGFRLMRKAVGRLMDEVDEEMLEEISLRLREIRRSDWIDLHQLRAWRSGDLRHIDLHLTLPRYWSIEKAHQTQDELQTALLRPYDGLGECIVHLDPCVPSCCSFCEVADCPVREIEFIVRSDWSRVVLVQGPRYLEKVSGPGAEKDAAAR